METLTKGNAAEAAVLNAFVKAGLDVLVPFGEGQPYDLVVHLPSNDFLRVQCKNGRRDRRRCLIFNCRTTDHGRGRQSYLGLADIFGIYDPVSHRVYLIPVAELPGFEGRLRLSPTRNNQRIGVRHARDYEIDRWTPDRLAAANSAGTSSRAQLKLAA